MAASEILDGVEGIKFINFGEEDVVRHRLVKRIIRAFAGKGHERKHGDRNGNGLENGSSVTEESDE